MYKKKINIMPIAKTAHQVPVLPPLDARTTKELAETSIVGALVLNVILFAKAFFSGAGIIYLSGYVLVGAGLVGAGYYVWRYSHADDLEKTVAKLKTSEKGLANEVKNLKQVRTALHLDTEKASRENSNLRYFLAQTQHQLAHQVATLGQENRFLQAERIQLSDIRQKLSEENAILSQSNVNLKGQITRLESCTQKIKQEFAEERIALKAELGSEINRLSGEITRLEATHAAVAKHLHNAEKAMKELIAQSAQLMSAEEGRELKDKIHKLNAIITPWLNNNKLVELLETVTRNVAELGKLEVSVAEKNVTLAELSRRIEEATLHLEKTQRDIETSTQELTTVKQDIIANTAKLNEVSARLHNQVIN
jgi:chromosome segregation ATPase